MVLVSFLILQDWQSEHYAVSKYSHEVPAVRARPSFAVVQCKYTGAVMGSRAILNRVASHAGCAV
jgi:hypothetical protein